MQDLRTDVIQRLFLKQIRNLTRYNTVYVSELENQSLARINELLATPNSLVTRQIMSYLVV